MIKAPGINTIEINTIQSSNSSTLLHQVNPLPFTGTCVTYQENIPASSQLTEAQDSHWLKAGMHTQHWGITYPLH